MTNRFDPLAFADDVVPEFIPSRSHQSPDDVHERWQIHFECHRFPVDRFRKLQVSLPRHAVEIDYKPSSDVIHNWLDEEARGSRFISIRFLPEQRWTIYAPSTDLIIQCLKANLTNLIHRPEMLSVSSIKRRARQCLLPINHVNFSSAVASLTTHWAERKSTLRYRVDRALLNSSRRHTAGTWIDIISRLKSSRFRCSRKSSCSTENWWWGKVLQSWQIKRNPSHQLHLLSYRLDEWDISASR